MTDLSRLTKLNMPIWKLLFSVLLSCVVAFVISFRAEILVGDYFVTNFNDNTPPSNIVIVTINEETLTKLPYRSPIDRAFLADVFKTIDAAEPSAIGLDILIDQASESAKDKEFYDTLRLAKSPVIVGYATAKEGLSEQQVAFEKKFLGHLQKGLVTLQRDNFDSTVRRIFTGRYKDTIWLNSLAASLAENAGFGQPFPTGRITYYSSRDGNPFAFPTYPAHSIKFLPKQWLKEKIVLIGTSLPATDQHLTPFTTTGGTRTGYMYGTLVHAHMLSQLINGDQIFSLGPVSIISIVFGFCLLLSLIAILRAPPLTRLIIITALIALFGFIAFYSFRQMHLQLPIITTLAAGILSTAILTIQQWFKDHESRKFIESAFSKYVSPAIVKKIISNRQTLVLGGEERTVTFLFTDLKGFTSLSETMEPIEVANLLNDYLDKMCTLFVEADATIDKIIGDAVVGFFGAPHAQEDQAERALKLALAIDKFSEQYRKELKQKNINLGITRIGVHKGPAIVGNLGGSRFMDYTGIGDTVNTAARMESANKYFGTRICVSDTVINEAQELCYRSIGDIIFLGKSNAISCFEPMPNEEANIKLSNDYAKAYQLMKDLDAAALSSFESLATIYPGDHLITMHTHRLQNGDQGVNITLGAK